MSEYDQLRSAVANLERLRFDLVKKIEAREGDTRTMPELHQRVSKALTALSGQG